MRVLKQLAIGRIEEKLVIKRVEVIAFLLGGNELVSSIGVIPRPGKRFLLVAIVVYVLDFEVVVAFEHRPDLEIPKGELEVINIVTPNQFDDRMQLNAVLGDLDMAKVRIIGVIVRLAGHVLAYAIRKAVRVCARRMH